ncbi:MAG: Ltp family lipoprotein [Candidatus Nanoarchaeia archaeon]|nr:Ltp family lipoprotein [Candidatus Nanoarchaeia archaeon]
MIKKVLGWIFIPYVMVGILVGRKTKSNIAGVMVGILAFFMLYAITSLGDTENDSTSSNKPSKQITVETTTETTTKTITTKSIETSTSKTKTPKISKVKKSVKSTKEETVAQKNAISAAESYISIMAFSKTGLIKQLKFDGYSKEDAEYAVDKLKINYNKQAEKAAKNYLDLMAFSRTGLIKQLKFDGYTQEQAVHGVNFVGL